MYKGQLRYINPKISLRELEQHTEESRSNGYDWSAMCQESSLPTQQPAAISVIQYVIDRNFENSGNPHSKTRRALRIYDKGTAKPHFGIVGAKPDSYLAFLSYRRENGSETARLLYLELLNRRISAFLDVEDLGNNLFDDRLFAVIESSPNFILILTPGCLARCDQEDDWLRREIVHALETERNIIPVLQSSFNFSDIPRLPDPLRDLPRYNGVKYDHNFFKPTVDRIVHFLDTD